MNTLILIPLLPLLSFLILGLSRRAAFQRTAGWIATLLMLVSAALAVRTAYQYFSGWGREGEVWVARQVLQVSWLDFSPGMSIDMGMLLDPVSVMMLVVVTVVSLMVHLFSVEYMRGEARYPVYFAFLGLFTFSMLGLVLSSNMFQMYIFWELVGLSSFLLIGFHYERPAAARAARKAFIVTRFADLGFLIGILILSFQAQTLDISTLIERLTHADSPAFKTALQTKFMGASALAWGLSLVFIGGAGKSALFPLHVWLPDAMEGPTPVSALIHAATMVVAGVFLSARLFPVFALSAPEVLNIIAFTGAFTALFAALIACTQTDIKRVLAYSTISQIGFMMAALGVSGYGGQDGLGFMASQFHLFTHAFFKALLFLCAGVVIHQVHSNEMDSMGGLVRRLPVTHSCFLVACLAIAGIPPLAGFFSKEDILLAAFERRPYIYVMLLLTSGITAFYMFRLYFRIFHWRAIRPADKEHPEGGAALLTPLVLLAIATLLVGWIPFGRYISSDGRTLETALHLSFSIAPVLMALIGIGLAAWFYRRQNERSERVARALGSVYQAAREKFYIDELYQWVTQKVIFQGIGRPAAWFDRHVVDGLVNLTGGATQQLSELVRGLQSGRVQAYALIFLAGLLILAGALVALH